ncbi:unnamed protein product [Eruca vesicaria subsp. sativa]|uniref:Uncharacterized protein n=1 Tax=Eruca vesicaria subsp. sativa TaxID=29727 RepID=A0ABC8JCP9_ERUVS|nr:unnamed protein product [Eruca vesicaria subsp. sativa]
MVRGLIVRLRVSSVASDLSPPEGCPFFDLSSLLRLQLDGCIRSRWTAKEAVISGARYRTTASSDHGFSSYRRWSLFSGLLWARVRILLSGKLWFSLEAVGAVAIRV